MLVYVGSPDPPSVVNDVFNNTFDRFPLSRVCSTSSVMHVKNGQMLSQASSAKTLSRQLVLLPGERRGWWSKHKYDRRTRMTSTVLGAVDDCPAKLLLDSGANVSILTTSFARKLGLLKHIQPDSQLHVQGISSKPLSMIGKVKIKITLMKTIVYFYEVWISDHQAGVDLLLGVDFLMSAGIRLDLYSGRAILPDEIRVPLSNIKDVHENTMARRYMIGPVEDLFIPSHGSEIFRVRLPKDPVGLVLWVSRGKRWVPTVVYTKTGEPKYIRITNISDVAQAIKRHEPVGQLVHEDHVPLKLGYVRTNSCRYQEWQTLAFEGKYSRRQEAELDDEFEQWVRDNPALPNKAPMPDRKSVV